MYICVHYMLVTTVYEEKALDLTEKEIYGRVWKEKMQVRNCVIVLQPQK